MEIIRLILHDITTWEAPSDQSEVLLNAMAEEKFKSRKRET